jgi:hypothetical protein
MFGANPTGKSPTGKRMRDLNTKQQIADHVRISNTTIVFGHQFDWVICEI